MFNKLHEELRLCYGNDLDIDEVLLKVCISWDITKRLLFFFFIVVHGIRQSYINLMEFTFITMIAYRSMLSFIHH